MGRRQDHPPDRLRLQLASTAGQDPGRYRPAPAGLWWEIVGSPTGNSTDPFNQPVTTGRVHADRLWAQAEAATVAAAWAGLAVLTAGHRPTAATHQTIMSGPYAATLALRRPALVRTLIVPELWATGAATAEVTVYANSLCLLTIDGTDTGPDGGDHRAALLGDSLRRFTGATTEPIGPVGVPILLDPPAARGRKCQSNE